MAFPPTFNGQAMFGLVFEMPSAENPRDSQRQGYPGLNGLESLDGGGRGRVTSVSGILSGAGESGLVAAEDFFRSYVDGRAYALTDTTGKAWPYPALLERFEPQGRYETTPDGFCLRKYTAEFLHLG